MHIRLRVTSHANHCQICARQSTAWHHVISTNCASQFRLFPTFLLSVPLLVVIWWYQEQVYNSATGHFVWLIRSPGTVYHYIDRSARTLLTFKNMLKSHLFHIHTSLTNCFQSTSSEHCTAPLSVTLALSLRLINCLLLLLLFCHTSNVAECCSDVASPRVYNYTCVRQKLGAAKVERIRS